MSKIKIVLKIHHVNVVKRQLITSAINGNLRKSYLTLAWGHQLGEQLRQQLLLDSGSISELKQLNLKHVSSHSTKMLQNFHTFN